MWRTAFGLGMIPLLFILYWRLFRLRESAVWAANQTNRNRGRETGLLFYHFWHRSAAPPAVILYEMPSHLAQIHVHTALRGSDDSRCAHALLLTFIPLI